MSAEYQVVTAFTGRIRHVDHAVVFEWNDVFDISVFPAVSAEEGLRVGQEVFGRLPDATSAG